VNDWNFDHMQQESDCIQDLIIENEEYSDKTIEEFHDAADTLKRAYIYARRVSSLLSNDDNEESFHKRLNEELDELYSNPRITLEIRDDIIKGHVLNSKEIQVKQMLTVLESIYKEVKADSDTNRKAN